VTVARRRLIGGVACLFASLIDVARLASPYALAGLVLGLVTGWALFRLAFHVGRVRPTPGVSWWEQVRMNFRVGFAGAGVGAGAAAGILLAGFLSVAAPSAEDVVVNALLCTFAGFVLSLRFSAVGRSPVQIG
jgi:hypothetical protein